VHQRLLAEHVLDRAADCLPAVDDKEDRLLGIQPRSTRSDNSERASVAFSVEPSHSPSGIFTPSVVIPSATTWQRSAISIPSSIITARRTSSSRRPINSSSAVRVRSMNNSDTLLLPVERDWRSTCSPTGSLTPA
jgi:hypothetical protein